MQSSAPDDGGKHRPKRVELTRNNKLTYVVASCRLFSELYHNARIHERQIYNFYLNKAFISVDICLYKSSIYNLLFQCSITFKLTFWVLLGMNMKANQGGIWNNRFGNCVFPCSTLFHPSWCLYIPAAKSSCVAGTKQVLSEIFKTGIASFFLFSFFVGGKLHVRHKEENNTLYLYLNDSLL